MNARELCQRMNVELVTPAEFAERYGIELDCDAMAAIEEGLRPVITVADENNLALVCHELAHVLYPAIDNHNVIIWLGILIYSNLKE